MESIKDLTLAQLVTKEPSTASILEKNDLDFCCKGKRTLQEACGDDEIKYNSILKEVEFIFQKDKAVGINFNDLSLSDLIDYIVGKHHNYLRELMPMIFAHTQKVALKHGDRHSELIEIASLFAQVKQEMEQHMMKEELILFPRIKEIENKSNSVTSPYDVDAEMVTSPIQVMEAEHEQAGSILRAISALTNEYNPPADACTTYKLSFNELKEFELDLHQHVHLENNILFPKAIELSIKSKQKIGIDSCQI